MANNMRQFLCVLLTLIAVFVSVGMLAGCKSDIQTVTPVTNAAPPKGSFPEAIKNNPNIPDSAKRAMMGQGGSPTATK